MAKLYSGIYDKQTETELDLILEMSAEQTQEYSAMFNDKRDTLVITRKQREAEDIDLYSENITRKTRREKKRSRDGYTVGNYKRKKERKDKNHDKWAEKKNAQKDTCFRLSDRLMGWCPDRDVKTVSFKEEEAEARKNADQDLTRQQMNYNGAFFRDLIRDRDDKADRIAEYAYRIDAYLASEMETQDNIFELEDQIKQLQDQLAVMKKHKADLMENRHRAEQNLDYNQVLYDMYDNVIKNQVLGIED